MLSKADYFSGSFELYVELGESGFTSWTIAGVSLGPPSLQSAGSWSDIARAIERDEGALAIL